MAAASNWLWNFGKHPHSSGCVYAHFDHIGIGYATPYLVNGGRGNANLGVKVFFIWGTTCLCCIIFAYLCVPETKGEILCTILRFVDVLMKPGRSHTRAGRHSVPEHYPDALGRLQTPTHCRRCTHLSVGISSNAQDEFASRDRGESVNPMNDR
jgi:hypothetical protein